MLNLLAELQHLGVPPAAFASACNGPKQRECAAIYTRYVQELERLHLLDPDDRTARAAAILRERMVPPVDGMKTVFLGGFNDFTAVQYDLLAALGERVEQMWVSLPDEPSAERAELFAVPRATRQRLASRVALAPGASSQKLPPVADAPGSPAGIDHLARQLFRPLRSIEVADNADGLSLIETPGVLGEARMIARRVKLLLLDGTRPDDILVVLRDLDSYADLLREVFAEYGLPFDMEGTEPLTRNGAVAALLRAVRLPDDDWPFAGVTAILRNTYFRPAWPEAASVSEMAHKAEAFLRLLGEPRGRDAYLAAARRWAEQIQPGLEDEQAEESRRRRTHELARQCADFLPRFFAAWNDAPATAPLAEHIAWLRRFADDLGLTNLLSSLIGAERSPHPQPLSPEGRGENEDRDAWTRFWEEIDRWENRGGRPLDRKTFHRRLAALAATAGLPKTARDHGNVRVLSAEEARFLDADFVFLLGLGERSFPRLALLPTLLDESERQEFQKAGIDFASTAELLPAEMLLFWQLVTKPRRGLVLSYPAVDERGQALLPSSFLLTVLDCFKPGAVPKQTQRMLTEGLGRDEPLSLAEYRVWLARTAFRGGSMNDGAAGSAAMLANLRDAADLVRYRFRTREYTPYDGRLRDPAVIGELTQMFGPERVFSPTALEEYVACPFRFFLRHVLRLEPMDDPKEEIEVTRRGQAFHRALSRLHRGLKEKGVHRPDDSVRAQMLREIGTAITEDMGRAPSPAAKELWRLEGQRLLHVAERYGEQWTKFIEPWLAKGVQPQPHFFEVDFGLPAADGTMSHGPLIIRADGIEVRVSGRIDRVDVAELPAGTGFWIIDYKTGRSEHYTGSHLAEFRRLQLTLYALAVEEVLLAGRDARPLGLAYWLVAETGAEDRPAGAQAIVVAGRNASLAGSARKAPGMDRKACGEHSRGQLRPSPALGALHRYVLLQPGVPDHTGAVGRQGGDAAVAGGRVTKISITLRKRRSPVIRCR